MADISTVQPVSGLGNAVRPTPTVQTPQVAQATQSDSASSSTDYNQARPPQKPPARTGSSEPPRAYDEYVLTGPPPTFEASLLEVERDIDAILRRLEANREMGQTPATRPDPSPVEPQPDDEASADGAPVRSDVTAVSGPTRPEDVEAPEPNATDLAED